MVLLPNKFFLFVLTFSFTFLYISGDFGGTFYVSVIIKHTIGNTGIASGTTRYYEILRVVLRDTTRYYE